MVTVVVVIVAIAAIQGLWNILKEAKHDFELVDPADLERERREALEDHTRSAA